MKRRSFLKALAISPVAAPVAAREAATKAGVGVMGLGPPPALADSGTNGDYVMRRLKEVWSPGWADMTREEMLSSRPSTLDPDLASSRSLSLSAAIRIQKERDTERRIEQSRGYWARAFKKATGMDWTP